MCLEENFTPRPELAGKLKQIINWPGTISAQSQLVGTEFPRGQKNGGDLGASRDPIWKDSMCIKYRALQAGLDSAICTADGDPDGDCECSISLVLTLPRDDLRKSAT